jgi:Tfp pilus assembly protein PilF
MEDPRILFERARSALAAGDPQAAAMFARRLLVMAPRQSQALHLLAVAERRNGRLDEARTLFESALAVDAGNAEVCNNFANLLDEMGKPAAARDLYRRAIERAPAYADALINLAVVCRKLDAVSEGLAAAARAVELTPASARAWIILGQLREDAGDGEGATAALDKALAIEPRNPRALAAAAALVLQRGGEATPAFDRALAVTPDDPRLALGRAASLHAGGDTPGAIAALERLVADAPGLVEAHTMLAKLYIAGGDIGAAGDGFRGGLSAQPQNEDLWLAYLQTLSKLSDYDALARAAEAAQGALGAHPIVLGFSAMAADERGDHDRAASCSARSIRRPRRATGPTPSPSPWCVTSCVAGRSLKPPRGHRWRRIAVSDRCCPTSPRPGACWAIRAGSILRAIPASSRPSIPREPPPWSTTWSPSCAGSTPTMRRRSARPSGAAAKPKERSSCALSR